MMVRVIKLNKSALVLSFPTKKHQREAVRRVRIDSGVVFGGGTSVDQVGRHEEQDLRSGSAFF